MTDAAEPPDVPADGRGGQPHEAPEFRTGRPARRYRRWMLFALIPLLAVGALAAGASIGIRRAADDPAEWHLDPLTAPTPSTPNSYRIAPVGERIDRDADAPTFSVSVADLADAFDAVAIGDDRVEVLAGSASDGFVTYVQRSAFFAFPDYVSVRFIEADGGGSTLAVFSRSRYGKSDLGVNKKRVTGWLDELGRTLT